MKISKKEKKKTLVIVSAHLTVVMRGERVGDGMMKILYLIAMS